MNTIRYLTLTTLVVLGGTAWAGDEANREGKHHGELKAKLLEKFDANHDGKLDESERAAAKAAMKEHHEKLKAKLLEKFDANHDGKLDESERAAAKAAMKKHHEEHHGKHAHKDGGDK